MAPLERLELPTNRFEAGYSIQLSYRGEVLPAIDHAGVLRNLASWTDQLAALRRRLLPMSSRPVEQLSIGSKAIKPVIAILADPGDQSRAQG